MKTIIYTIKSETKEIMCIDEFKDNKIIHHTNGGLFLMDDPYNEELKFMVDFTNTEECLETVQNMNDNESKTITFNGYEFIITIKEIANKKYEFY